ncbi:MAG TPA: WYL domain-containing protein [Pyrinomonadaceae bacterium]|nr:WYL domain-containing protein [Pyrinomonadaceae bacterium]
MKTDRSQQTLKRSQRLISLMLEITNNPRQQPEQLWRTLGVGKSQFFEDKQALAELGFSFDYDRKERRYKITSDLGFPVFGLTMSEVFSLVMAVRQLSAAGDHALTFDAVNAIRKIISQDTTGMRSLLSEALDHQVLRRTFHVEAEIISNLRQAQQACQRLEIRYDDFSQGSERTLEIDPYMLYFKGRALYLDAFVLEERRVLMLRVSRIKQVLRRTGPFKVRDDYNFKERHRHSYRVIVKETQPERVRIRFTAPTSRHIAEAYWHESERKFPNDMDGSLILELTVSDPLEVLWYLAMPWAEGAEILEPAWLREEAVRTAQLLIAKYDNGGSVQR